MSGGIGGEAGEGTLTSVRVRGDVGTGREEGLRQRGEEGSLRAELVVIFQMTEEYIPQANKLNINSIISFIMAT